MINCLLLSAGLGTRLRPITEQLAKPAVPVLGVPMLGFPLYYLEKTKLKNLCINTHYKPESIHRAISELKPVADNIIYYDESREIMGSGGALLGFKEVLQEDQDFILINADNVFLHENQNLLSHLVSLRRKENVIASVLVTPHKEAGRTIPACWTSNENIVSGFGLEPPELHAKPHHYVGAMCISRKVFNYLPSDKPSNILYDVLLAAKDHGENLIALNAEDLLWLETGLVNDYYKAQSDLLEKLPQSQCLSQLIQRFAPHMRLDTHNGGSLLKHQGATLDPSVSIQDWSIVTKPIHISGQAELNQCVIHSESDMQLTHNLHKEFIFQT